MVIQSGKEYRTCRLSCKNLEYLDLISCKKTYDEVVALLIKNYKAGLDKKVKGYDQGK